MIILLILLLVLQIVFWGNRGIVAWCNFAVGVCGLWIFAQNSNWLMLAIALGNLYIFVAYIRRPKVRTP